WRDSATWPPPHTPPLFALHSAGGANTRSGNGALTTQLPADEPPDSFVYDPDNPVPTVGGRTLFYHPAFGSAVVADQAGVEEREDVLVYSSARLTRLSRIAGAVTLTLFASTSGGGNDCNAK